MRTVALLLVYLLATAAASGTAHNGYRRSLSGCTSICRGLGRGPVPRRICPGRSVVTYGNKYLGACYGWSSRIYNLGTLGQKTRIQFLSGYGNAAGSSFGLSLPRGVDMIPIVDTWGRNGCVLWIRHDYVCYV